MAKTDKTTDMSVNNEKLKALKLTMDKLEKDYGKGSVMMLGDKTETQQEVISTGSIGLDVALGIGGLPRGRIVEIYGPESSGKTTIATHVIAEAQKKDTGSNRFFEAYYNVRIFSDSLQAVGDSLFYSLQDSAFRLFKDPVVWTESNQLSGDTIYLFTRNKKPERLNVFENGLAVSQVQGEYFNQVKGNTITGYFKEGNIDYLRTRGNAESIYYATDDDTAFIGVNQSTADVIDMYFENRKPQRVVFRNDLKGTTYPMRQVNHSELRLRGFKWLQDRRPASWQELLK